MLEVALGVQYMHLEGVVHGNLHAVSILTHFCYPIYLTGCIPGERPSRFCSPLPNYWFCIIWSIRCFCYTILLDIADKLCCTGTIWRHRGRPRCAEEDADRRVRIRLPVLRSAFQFFLYLFGALSGDRYRHSLIQYLFMEKTTFRLCDSSKVEDVRIDLNSRE